MVKSTIDCDEISTDGPFVLAEGKNMALTASWTGLNQYKAKWRLNPEKTYRLSIEAVEEPTQL